MNAFNVPLYQTGFVPFPKPLLAGRWDTDMRVLLPIPSKKQNTLNAPPQKGAKVSSETKTTDGGPLQ